MVRQYGADVASLRAKAIDTIAIFAFSFWKIIILETTDAQIASTYFFCEALMAEELEQVVREATVKIDSHPERFTILFVQIISK